MDLSRLVCCDKSVDAILREPQQRKLGIPEWQAYPWGNTRLGYWRIAGSAMLNRTVTNEKLAQVGYYDFPA